MNFFAQIRCALLLWLLVAGVASGQWVQSGPSGFYTCILKTPAGILVGTTGSGIWFSSDNGASWSDMSAGLTSLDVTGLAGSGASVFASTRGGGVFLRSNNAGTWSPVNNFLISSNIGCVSVMGTVLFAGPAGYGAFTSTDNGSIWLPAGKGIGTDTVSVFFGKGARIFAGTMRGVYSTVDGGKNWTSSSVGLPSGSNVTAFASAGTLLFAGVFRSGVFVSSDEGASWFSGSVGLADGNVTCLASVPVSQGTTQRLLAGTATGGVFASTDNGVSWSAVDTGPSGNQVGAFAVDGENVYAAVGEGVKVSGDGGVHWGGAGAGLSANRATCFGFVESTLYAGTSRGGVYVTSDKGNRWRTANQQLANFEVSSMAVAGTRVYIGTSGGSVFRRDTSDLGWIRGGEALASLPIHAMGSSGGVLFAAPGLRGIFYSIDEGGNWMEAQGSVVDVKGTEFTSFAIGQGYLFGGSLGAGVFRSTDNAVTWSRRNTGLGNLSVHAVTLNATLLYAGTSLGVYRSANNGETWQSAGSLLNGMLVSSLASYGSTLIAGTSDGGVYVSTDQGNGWLSASQGLPLSKVGGLAVEGEYAFAGTFLGGVHRRSLSELLANLTGVAGSAASASAFELMQNYPNPFNATTVVKYRVPALGGVEGSGTNGQLAGVTSQGSGEGGQGSGASLVRLVVYDLLGREVAALVDERKVPGSYEARWDGTGFATGVYICRLSAKDYIASRKMLLLR